MRVNVRKRGKVYQYQFEIPRINGKRKFINKSGFKTHKEALLAGYKALDEYMNGGVTDNVNMTYSDYLDYWLKEYLELNYKYTTAKRYKESFGPIKQELGKYTLRQLTPYMINQALLRLSQKLKTSTALKNYQKVIKSSFKAATNHFGFIQYDPAATLSIPRVLSLAVKKTD